MTFRFDPTDAAFVDDPYPTYKILRDAYPAYRDEARGFWLITRHDDVGRALLDPATYSSARGNVTIDSPVRVGKTLGTMDPPRHDALRRIIIRGFTPERIKAGLPSLREHAAQAMAALKARGGGDLVADFGRPVLYSALGRLLGLDADAALRGSALMAGLFRSTDGPMGNPLPGTMAPDIAAFLSNELARRREAGGDDLISMLVAAKAQGADIEDDQIVANMMTVLLAGNASIGHFFPTLLYALWQHPDQRRMVRDDPALVDAAIEETVRWDTSTHSFARSLTTDVEIAGTKIPAQSRLVLFYAAANRDERAIDDPDRFTIHRAKQRHFGFGSGPHFCLGAQTARAMLGVVLREILPVMGDYELDLTQAKRAHHVMVRGFTRLPVRF